MRAPAPIGIVAALQINAFKGRQPVASAISGGGFERQRLDLQKAFTLGRCDRRLVTFDGGKVPPFDPLDLGVDEFCMVQEILRTVVRPDPKGAMMILQGLTMAVAVFRGGCGVMGARVGEGGVKMEIDEEYEG